MPRSRVKIDPAGIRALLHSPGVRADLRRRGRRVAARATATAPVDTGQFAGIGPTPGGFEVIDHETPERTTVRVQSRDPKGSIKESQFHTLASALEAAR